MIIDLITNHYLSALPLVAHICASLQIKLCDSLITFSIVVHSQYLIDRNVAKLFSSNLGVSHLNEACCVDEVSRGFVSGPEKFSQNSASVYHRVAS